MHYFTHGFALFVGLIAALYFYGAFDAIRGLGNRRYRDLRTDNVFFATVFLMGGCLVVAFAVFMWRLP